MRFSVARGAAARLSSTYQEQPYWWAETAIPDPGVVPLPTDVDVAIVGAGYTGLSAAMELARLGRSVVVLERHRLAWGASSRNGGMVHPGGKHSIDEILAMPQGRELWDITIDAFEGVQQLVTELSIDCGWERCGHLELAHHPRLVAGQRRAAAAYRSIGEDAELLGPHELASQIGSTEYHGGLLVQRSGALHPARFAAGLATATLAAGAIVRERTDVVAVERDGVGFVVRTGSGQVRAGDVVIATNGYTDGLVPWLHRRILPVGSYIIATEPLAREVTAEISPHRRMFFDTKNFLYYWRLSPDGSRVLFGGRTSFAPTTVERSRDALYAAMVRVHPQLAEVQLDFAWGGNVALTFDRMPHLGRHPDTGVVYAMGYCGTGVALATHFGRLIGGWLAGKDALPPYAARHWTPVPPPARVSRLLPVAGWWYQARDRLGA